MTAGSKETGKAVVTERADDTMMGKNEVTETGVTVVMEDSEEQVHGEEKETMETEIK